MKKAIIVLIFAAFFVGGCVLIPKKQTETARETEATNSRTVTIEDFVGEWKAEYIRNREDLTDNLLNYWFEIRLEKDAAKENSLKGRHCSVVRGGRQMDCVDDGETHSLYGYLKNNTVYLHFVSAFGGEGEAKLYFGNTAQSIIWELVKYEYKIENFIPQNETLRKVNKEIPK